MGSTRAFRGAQHRVWITVLNRVTCAHGTGAAEVPWGEKGRAPHSASCTACAPAYPSSPGSGPRPWLQCLHAAWRQFSPPTPFLVPMATPVEITLKRNETSSFSVWQVGGGELSWERLGKGFEEVWRERTVGCIPTWGPSTGGSRAGGMWGHPPLWHLVLAVLDRTVPACCTGDPAL